MRLPRPDPDRVGPGQESVWAYPRPPRVEPCALAVRVEHGGVVVAASTVALRVLETAGPPTIYVPRADVDLELVHDAEGSSVCEWKGRASYHDVVVGARVAPQAAWSYAQPWGVYAVLTDHLAFYPGRLDGCWLGGERVRPQEGGFYGGWVTDAIVGPWKGRPGTEGW
jgi:uncharacterized protein (DUF427 family)